jgi:hypothetical protein
MTDSRQMPSSKLDREGVVALRGLVNAALPLQSREHLTRAEWHYIRQALGLGIAAVQKLDEVDALRASRSARARRTGGRSSRGGS